MTDPVRNSCNIGYIDVMRHRFLTFAILLAATPVAAQDNTDRGLGLMERGAQLFLEGILKEMEPALNDLADLAEDFGPAMRQFAQEMGPKLRGILEEVEDWSVYLPPAMLPNGDIIIRRKPDAPRDEPPTQTEPAPQVDL